jgi:cold-inducible RNA-binding protein
MKLYVGNLPYEARDEELRELFESYGTITKAQVIVSHQRDRSRGFGFVEFADPSHAKAAIEALHGHGFGGRQIVVNEARSFGGGHDDHRGQRGGFGRDNRGAGHSRRF